MKAFNWGKMPANKYGNTVFEKLKADQVDLNVSELESLFSVAEVVREVKPETAPKKDEKVSQVDPKLAQNTAIFLKSEKVVPKELKEVILTECGVKQNYLNEEKTRKLIDNSCPDEELAKIREFAPGNEDKLHDVDKYFLTMAEIPQCKQRLETWLFCLTFNERYERAKQELLKIKSAVNCMKENGKGFLELIELILAVGNFINSGGRNGSAPGFFLLKTLDKLKDIKATDENKTSLLTYLIKYSQKKHPNIMAWVSAFEPLKYAKSVELVDTQGDIQCLRSEFKTNQKKIESVQKADSKWDVYDVAMPAKYAMFGEELDNIEKMAADVDSTFVSLILEYGEDKKTKTKEFFGALTDFMETWTKAEQDLKIAEQKAIQAAEQKAKEDAKAALEAKKAEMAERRARIEEKKRLAAAGGKAEPKKEEKPKEEDAAADAFTSVLEGAKVGEAKEAFQKRRLRRQDTLRQKRAQAAENAAK